MDPFCYLCFVSVMLSCNSLQPCDHLLRKGLPLGSLVCNVFVSFPCGVLGQVIPDLCILPYFNKKHIGVDLFSLQLCVHE